LELGASLMLFAEHASPPVLVLTRKLSASLNRALTVAAVEEH
jgi:hypothetical protein